MSKPKTDKNTSVGESRAVTNVERPKADSLTRVFGADPWARFDMWAARAWDAAERGVEFSIANGGAVLSYESNIDPRVAAIFHMSEVAKEFAIMVNPLNLLDESGCLAEDSLEEMLFDITIDNENEGLD